MENIFNKEVASQLVDRINQLKPNTIPNWGKMNAAQMLAHCNVTYEMVYTDKHPKPSAFMRFILKAFVKNSVVNEKPYKHNSQTAPQFIMVNDRNFEEEKQRLISFIEQTRNFGQGYFDNKVSHSFGKLSSNQWNNMFYKHLDHHLGQFGV